MPGPPSDFVFSRRWNREGLAAILLRDAQEPAVPRPHPVEALDDKHAPPHEILHLGFRGCEAQCADKLKAQMLVFDAVRKINAVRQLAYLRLENVGCGCGAVRHVPLVLPVEQRGFFLRSRQRNPEFSVRTDAQRIVGKVLHKVRDFVICQGTGFHLPGWRDGRAVGDKLESADAIAADCRQQVINIGPSRLRALGKPSAYVVVVG